MVNVLSKDGCTLHATHRHGKVRHLLKQGHAVVVKKSPFTIRLTYETTNKTTALQSKI